MARLIKLAEWHGPGESRTATVLESSLPADWVVIAGFQIPTKDREDVDFLVVGENRLFVVEEKNWGPYVEVDEPFWKVNGFPRKSPVYGVAHKARVLRGWLPNLINPESSILRQRPVQSAIVLSREGLGLRGTLSANDFVYDLSSVCSALLARDAERTSDLKLVRESLIEGLSGLPAADHRIEWLNDFKVTASLGGLGWLPRFDGEDPITGQKYIFNCFPMGEDGEPTPESVREAKVWRKLQQLNRSWRIGQRFRFDPRNWYVVPIERPDSDFALSELWPTSRTSDEEDPIAPEPHLTLGPSDVVTDAFAGLASIHAEGILHRLLAPSRLWLGQGGRVFFTDFFFARVEGEESLVAFTGDAVSKPYRAPEAAADVHDGTASSDVYSLAFILGEWATQKWGGTALEIELELEKMAGPWLKLAEALSSDPSTRPNAAELSEAFHSDASPVESPVQTEEVSVASTAFQVGKRLLGKYRLDNCLQRSQRSSVWFAEDELDGGSVVIKQFHSEAARDAFRESSLLYPNESSRCQRILGTFNDPEEGFAVLQFIKGKSLIELRQSGNLDFKSARKIASNGIRALTEAFHSKGKIHGDVTPGNLVVDEDFEVYLVDTDTVQDIGLPKRGLTVAYSAPELLTGNKLVSPQTDLYGFCCSLIELMLNRRPYIGDPKDPERDCTVEFASPQELASWGPDGEALLRLIFRGVEPQPELRPRNLSIYSRELARAKAIAPELLPELNAVNLVNPNVESLRGLFVESRLGNGGMLGIDAEYARSTYIETSLDTVITPGILRGEFDVVILTGNPGDGKTSFIQKVGIQLDQMGASKIAEDGAGWSREFEGRTLSAVYDASESSLGLSSNEIILNSLKSPLANSKKHTSLIAMNDGRLFSFIDDFGHEFPALEEAFDQYRAGLLANIDGKLIIDLKSRALVSEKEGGLALNVLGAITDESLWEASNCADCASRLQCPILANVKDLRANGRQGLQELVLSSHLSSGRRATLRDLRSALSWTITGDQGCEDIHKLRENGVDLTAENDLRLWNLAFDSKSQDKLLSEWRRFDPALYVSPVVSRELSRVALESGESLPDREEIQNEMRKIFFGLSQNSSLSELNVSVFKHLHRLWEIIKLGIPDVDLLNDLLLGLSRVVGAPGAPKDGLYVSQESGTSDWRVVKVLPASDFALETISFDSEYIEQMPDHLLLRYIPMDISLKLDLDSIELLLRSSEGELFNDHGSEAARKAFEAFGKRVAYRASAHQATLYSPVGDRWLVGLSGDELSLRGK